MVRSSLVALIVAAALAGCSGSGDTPHAPSSQTAAAQPEPAAAPVPQPTDEPALRDAAARALAEQRLYSPAGDNAIEHYLALRELAPDDTAVETALVELLPYALIGSEQAVAREDFAEARRLIGLIGRADADLPALTRLRDGLVAAEAEATRRAEAEAVAQAAADAEAARQRELASVAAPATPAPAAAPPPRPAPSQAQAAATVSPPPAPAPVAAAPAPAFAASAAARTPRLLSAPSPRYPLMALRRKLEGEVVLELTVQPDGRVGAARVISATPPGLFDEAAMAAVERWRFEAGPGVVTTRQQVRFRLPGADRPAG